MINLVRLYRSFKFAFRGLISLIRKEQNFRVHLISSVAIIFVGLYFEIKVWQWCLVILMIAIVLILEILNTIMERMVDMLQPRIHHYAGEIKDMMSGVVLVAAITSVIIALLIFIPYF